MATNDAGPLVVVVGTGTEIGKTFVSVALVGHLRARGLSVKARKLAQSFEAADPIEVRDAFLLGAATDEPIELVCPANMSFPVAMAPPMAAEALGRSGPTLRDLLAFAPFDEGTEVGLIETAGGVRSPQATDADAVDVVDALDPDLVVLVADAGLGTISAVRLCVEALRRDGRSIAVVLNRFEPGVALHEANRRWLQDRDGLELYASPSELDALGARIAELS